MVPGLTSKGGRLPSGVVQKRDGGGGKGGGEEEEEEEEEGRVGEADFDEDEDIPAGEVVIIKAEGKEEACMVGVLKMGTDEMRRVGKGVAIEGGHYLGDGLWRLKID